MKKVKFRKGTSSVYSKWYANNKEDDQTIFFTTDTHQIIIHGDSYGSSEQSQGSIESIYWDEDKHNIYYTIAGQINPISLNVPYVNLLGYGLLDQETYQSILNSMNEIETIKKDYYGEQGTKQIVDETKNWIDVNN